MFTNSCHWKAETVKDYKSTRRIAFTAKHVISKIRVKILIGSCPRVAADLLMTACKVDHLIRIENVRMCNIIHRSKLVYYLFLCAMRTYTYAYIYMYIHMYIYISHVKHFLTAAQRKIILKCLYNITLVDTF